MKRVAVTRTVDGDQGTFGKIVAGGRSWCSLELPGRGNKPYVSRIPAGIYTCQWTYSTAFERDLYIVLNVPGRSGIMLHSANWAGNRDKNYYSQLLGCIAPGLGYGQMIPTANEQHWQPQWAVTDSRDALKEFEDYLDRKEFELHVIDAISDVSYEWALAPAA
ncbi:MAG: hypothetical protein KOO63_05470 [Bacteroidales bacterium]|nr:hypothetical protein [Candidatus Latescibacterota bacterium]